MRSSVLFLSVSFSLVMAACSSSEETPAAEGGDPCAPEVTRAAGSIPPSFKNDIVPLFKQSSCTATGCHGSSGANGGIYLPGTNPDLMYEELKKESVLVKGMKFVVPSDPKNSWLMVKLDGKQGAYSAKCADTTGKLKPNDCGQTMPQSNDPLLPKLPEAKRNLVRSWICDGAKKD
jgi:hypothetical protein